MGIKEMTIFFDNPSASYYSGTKVSGRLVLNLNSPKKIRDITIKFKGLAEVKWTETESRTDHEGKSTTVYVDYTSRELYFENKFIVLGGGGAEITIPSGTHNYDFSTIIPPSVPSTYEGEFGHIRYTVKATLNRPWKFDQECKAAFTVITPVDLNTLEGAQRPLQAEKEKSVGVLCCQSGPLVGRIQAPLSGYVSGQTVPLTIEIVNMTNSNVTGGSCILQKVVQYVASSPHQKSRTEKIKISSITISQIGAHGSNKWTEEMIIPPLPATNSSCRIISFFYELVLDTSVSGMFKRGLTMTTPIIIGNIPLINFNVQTQPPMPQFNQYHDSAYPSLPPPSYEECTIGKAATIKDEDDSEHTLGIGGWVPRYPTFKYNPTPSAPLAES